MSVRSRSLNLHHHITSQQHSIHGHGVYGGDTRPKTACPLMQSPAYLEPNQNHTITSLLRWLRNAQDDNCLIPLHMASCKRNHVAALQVLLEHGANVDVRNDRGQTPLHVASQLDFPDVMQLLLKCDANPDAQDQSWSPGPQQYDPATCGVVHKKCCGHTTPARV
jgi:hypothetical protein